MEQVLVRRKRLHGNVTELKLANVVAQGTDSYKVAIIGEPGAVEVKKVDVLPVPEVMGQARVTPYTLLPTKSLGAAYSLSRRG